MATVPEPPRRVNAVLAGGAYAQTLSRGLVVLELLAEAGRPLSTDEVADRLGTNRSVAYRLLHTLEGHRLVALGDDGRFLPGLGLVSLAHAVRTDLRTAAYPILRRVAEQAGATVTLSAADENEVVILLAVEPPGPGLHIAMRVGLRRPLHRGSPGIAILAGRPATPGEDPAVTAARRVGYAESRGAFEAGAHGVSAPVPSPHGQAQYSVTAVLFDDQDRDAQTIGEHVKAAAAELAALV